MGARFKINVLAVYVQEVYFGDEDVRLYQVENLGHSYTCIGSAPE